MTYFLPNLPYPYNGLEPFFDEKTMIIHHTKHHQNYINNTNSIIELTEYSLLPAESLIIILDKISIDKKIQLKNNLGGHVNHSLFWKGLKLHTKLTGKLKESIEEQFGSEDKFKIEFEKKALEHFGSGWIWLVNSNGILSIVSTVNQDNPWMGKELSGVSGDPIICIDLWEHAYYLKFQNNRMDYLKSFWNVVNWDEASRRFEI